MNMRTSYIVLFIYIAVGYSNTDITNHIDETQAHRLISAAWERPVTSIEVTIYKEVKKPPRNIELIRKELEQELKEAEQQYEILRNNGMIFEEIDLESEFKKRIEAYNQPKLFKELIRIDGYSYRLDQTSIKSDIDVGPEADVHRTYVNCGNKEKDDYTHFSYDHKHKQATISNNKNTVWREHRFNEYIGIPTGVSYVLKKLFSKNNSGIDDDTPMPDGDAISQLINGELNGFRIEIDKAEVGKQIADKITFTIGPQNKKYCCLIVDKENYSRVYSYEIYDLETGNLNYRREAKEFSEEGYPRQIFTISYNNLGKIVEEERITVENVNLEAAISEDLFKFTVPSGYTMVDARLSPALIIKATDEIKLIETDLFLAESSLPKASNVSTEVDNVSIKTRNNLTKGNKEINGQEKQIKEAKVNYHLYSVITLFVLGFILAFMYKHKKT